MTEDKPASFQVIDRVIGVYRAAMGQPLVEAKIPEYSEKIMDVGATGGTEMEMAAALGVSQTAMRRMADANGTFAESLRQARTLSQAWWEAANRIAVVDTTMNATHVRMSAARHAAHDDNADKVGFVPEIPDDPIDDDAVGDTTNILDTEIDREIEVMVENKAKAKAWMN